MGLKKFGLSEEKEARLAKNSDAYSKTGKRNFKAYVPQS
jgi:hypothetical protein